MHPDPIFTIAGMDVYMYGVCIAIGILACFIIYFTYLPTQKVNQDVQDFGFFVAIGAIASGFGGAALFQAFYGWIATGKWSFGGLTVMGGIIGGVVMFLVLYFGIGHFRYKDGIHKKQFNHILRVAPICICAAHGFGRIGCLFSGCCHGAFLGTDPVVGGIWMDSTFGKGYYVPTQLYESIFLFVLGGILTFLYFKKFNFTASIYLIAYGIWRFIIEFFRADDRGGTGVLQPSQWQSFIFIGIGIALILLYVYVFKAKFWLKEDSPATNK